MCFKGVREMEWDKVKDFLSTAGVDLLRGIITVIVGLFLVHWVMKLIDRYDERVRLEPTLKGFLVKLVRIVLSILVLLTAANTMGIPLTSIVTLIASAGVAISLAMQGILSNLIGGFILLLLKPIRVGEFVKVGDYEGTVQVIGVFYTEMTTFDNRHINLPNSTLTNTAIINYTREGTRRLDLVFSVSYDSELDQVYQVLRNVVAAEKEILQDPEPAVNLSKCGDSALDFTVKVWVKTENYWPVNFRLLENGKRSLDAAGIKIPYPQMDVHVISGQQGGV